jgi:hypothetical protein
MRARRRSVTLLALGALCVAGVASAVAGATSGATHLTRDEQVAAKAATTAYRAQISQAGQQLSTSLVALDASLDDDGVDPDPAALAEAQAAFDTLRVQMSDPSAASTAGGAPTLAAALWSPSLLRSAHGELAQAAPVLTFVLGRVILSPQSIAQSAQRSSGWISRTAPGALAGSAPQTRADLEATARSITVTMAGLSGIGHLVAPDETDAATAGATRLLSATSSPSPSLRQIVADADVLSIHLGRLGGALKGYGKGSLYQ